MHGETLKLVNDYLRFSSESEISWSVEYEEDNSVNFLTITSSGGLLWLRCSIGYKIGGFGLCSDSYK
jgi:hypothetical protein